MRICPRFLRVWLSRESRRDRTRIPRLKHSSGFLLRPMRFRGPGGLTVLTIGSQSLESRLNESQVHDLVHLDLGSDQTLLEIPLLVVLNFFEIHLAVGREFRSIQADSQRLLISGAGIFSDDIDDAIEGLLLFEYRVIEIALTFEKAHHELFPNHWAIPHQRVRVEQVIGHMAGKKLPQVSDADADALFLNDRDKRLHEKSHVHSALRQRAYHIVEWHHAHHNVGLLEPTLF